MAFANAANARMMFSLRPATIADQAFCWQLHQATMKPYVAATWGWDEADQLARFEAGFDPGTCQIIEVHGDPVGVLQVDLAGTPVRLRNLQIAPRCQRRGLGSAVIRSVLDSVEGRGVRLRVLKVNPARHLYERMGFGVTGETATHWQMHYPATSSRSTSAR